MPRTACRTKSLEFELLEGGRAGFTLALLDRDTSPGRELVIHSLEVTGELALDNLEILRIEARAISQPFPECAGSLAPVTEMTGARIGPGFRARVLEVMGRVHGCTHFMTLMLDLAAAHTLSTFLRMREQAEYSDEMRRSGDWMRTGLAVEPRLEDACIALRSDSPVIRNARATQAPEG